MKARSRDFLTGITHFFGIFLSSFAFLVVAFLVAVAGFALSASDDWTTHFFSRELPLLALYILILWPYYASRHGLLERKLHSPQKPIDSDSIIYGIQYPVFVIILVAIMMFQIFKNNFLNFENQELFLSYLAGIFIGLLPFFMVFVASLRNLASDQSDRAFEFSERVLYPALCTGVIPFSFGWAIAASPINLSVIVWATAYIILLIVVAKWLPDNEFRRVSYLFVFVFVAYLFIMIVELKVIILGTVITLAMGVSEASKRVFQSSTHDRYFPHNEDYEYYLAGSNWASIVFLWLLGLVPLAIKELPTLPFLTFISLQSLIWLFSDDTFKRSRRASIISLLFGYGLPMTIILTRIVNIQPTFLPIRLELGTAIGVWAGIVAITGAILGFESDFRSYLTHELRKFAVKTYLVRKYNYYMFIIVVLWIVGAITSLIGSFSYDLLTSTKASELLLVISAISFVVLARYLMESHTNGITKEENANP